jgi:hypothetical protein
MYIWLGYLLFIAIICVASKIYLTKPYSKEHIARENKLRASLNLPSVEGKAAKPIVNSTEYLQKYMPKI